MIESRPAKAILFDLDGTLLDTLDDIAASANRVLAGAGLPVHDRDAYRRFVGDGSRLLITRALPEDQRHPSRIEACLAAFMADYGDHWRHATRPYPGIPTLLEALAQRSLPCAVVTNKPQAFADRCVNHFFPQAPFRIVVGQQDGRPLKPHPRPALAAADHLGVPPGACLLIGDSDVDMATAQAAGMLPLGAAWGFRSAGELGRAGAAAVIREPREVLPWIDGKHTA